MKRTILMTLLAAATLSAGRPALAQVLQASVEGGRVQGVLAGSVVSFKGIPYAAAPVGPLRWRPPQPPIAWSGVREADHFAPTCMQDPRFIKFFGAPPGLSEDCLYLNVWTPAKSASERLPVMVWIHGGGFDGDMASNPVYDGNHLATLGVLVVSMEYRMGAFGFLADPALSREGRGLSGNYGLMDILAALRWVKANIAQFGGDPAQVTIFGESAGGSAVSMLAASPAARGLFERAICESGGSLGSTRYANEPGLSVRPLAQAQLTGQQFLARLGALDLAAARALSADDIEKGMGSGLQGRFGPVVDGQILSGHPYQDYQQGHFNDTPVLIGTNSDEGSLFVRPGTTAAQFEQRVRADYGPAAAAILAAYPHATPAEASQAAMDLQRDTAFGWNTWAWAMLQSQHGRGKVYLYYFDQRTPRWNHGAPHTEELGYVFGTLSPTLKGPAQPSGAVRPEDHALSALMNRYWVNFATTGNPNGPGLPFWPAFTPAAQRAMFLDSHAAAHPAPNLEQLHALDAYFAWRRSQGAKSAAAGPTPP